MKDEIKIPKRKITPNKNININEINHSKSKKQNKLNELDNIINNIDKFTINQMKESIRLLSIKLKEIIYKEQYFD